ncbi:MAG: amidohydrolase [Bacteroidetes bacterium]|nr:amidohydrolase [Bacteroidota bacterium]
MDFRSSLPPFRLSRLGGFFLLFILHACSFKKQADCLIVNARIYTADSVFSVAEAMAIRDGKILATGSRASIEQKFKSDSIKDMGGRTIVPGLNDAHAHFIQYALGLQEANLVGTTSLQETLERTKSFFSERPNGWVVGRGWDQNDWPVKEFPDNRALNDLFPDRPALLIRIDGHAALANQTALKMAGVQPGDTIVGGEYVTRMGKLTGLLIDNAVDRVSKLIPAPSEEEYTSAMLQAQRNCFESGLTSLTDCGLHHSQVKKLMKLQEEEKLLIRLNVMLSDDPTNYRFAEDNGKIKTDRMTVHSIKVYGDGALGSRGACLLHAYHDQPGHYGFLLSQPAHFDSVAKWSLEKEWQLCTHAIGDSGNRVILNTYAKYLPKRNNLRWRIEHAQVVNPYDLVLFRQLRVIPSVQPTHATSDMYWAERRLGSERIKHAYAYQTLLEQNGWMPLGTDFPVEDISPIKTFYSAVIRKDAAGWPSDGFLPEFALTREQALRGMTIWAAKGSFEEKTKGSLEKGKWADFVVLDQDLMQVDPEKIIQTQVLATYLNGKAVYQKK